MHIVRAEPVFEVEPGLGFIAGGDPNIEARVGNAGFADRIEGIGVGDADLTGFLDYFERGVVLDPGELGMGEVFFRG